MMSQILALMLKIWSWKIRVCFALSAIVVVVILLLLEDISDIYCPAYSHKAICKPYGSIVLSDPQVFTREHLVNDRLKEEKWLTEMLDTAGDDKGRFEVANSSVATTQTTKIVGSAELGAEAQEDKGDETTKPDETKPGETKRVVAKIETRLPPIDVFRAIEAYREEVRDELMATQLDDRHDLNGNTLIRLSFNASILAGRDPDDAALIYVTAAPSLPAEIDRHDYKTEALKPYIDTYEEWRYRAQQQFDKAADSLVQAIDHLIRTNNASAFPPAQSAEFRVYVRDRFLREVEEEPDAVSDLRDRWAPKDATTSGAKNIERQVRERAQVLFYFFLSRFRAEFLQRSQEDYKTEVSERVTAAVEASEVGKRVDGAKADGPQVIELLNTVGFCERKCEQKNIRVGDAFLKRTVFPQCTAGGQHQVPVGLDLPALQMNLGITSQTAQSLQGPGDNVPAGRQAPDTQTPDTQTPGTQTPGTQTPGTQTPGTQTPGTQTPGTQTPGTQTPGTQTPSTQTQGTQKPGTRPLSVVIDCPALYSDEQLQLLAALQLLSLTVEEPGSTIGFRRQIISALMKLQDDAGRPEREEPPCPGANEVQPGIDLASSRKYSARCRLFSMQIPPLVIRHIVVEYLLWKYHQQDFVRYRVGTSAQSSMDSVDLSNRYFTLSTDVCGFMGCTISVNERWINDVSRVDDTHPMQAVDDESSALCEFGRAAEPSPRLSTINAWLETARKRLEAAKAGLEKAEGDRASTSLEELRKAESQLEFAESQFKEAQVENRRKLAKQLCIELNRDPKLYSYVVNPKVIAQNKFISGTESTSLGAAVAARLNLSQSGTANLQMDRGSLSESMAAEANVIGFAEVGSTEGTPPCVPDAEESRPITCFGWVIRPPTNGKDTLRLGARRYPVSVVLSVPSWWKSLRLMVRQCWVPSRRFFSEQWAESAPTRLCKDSTENTAAPSLLTVAVPGNAREITDNLGPQIILPPYLDMPGYLLTDQYLVAGKGGNLVLLGERLWKSPKLLLGDQAADGIEVLPDMQGIVASFDCIETPQKYYLQVKNTSGPTGQSGTTVQTNAYLWTSEGRVEPFQIQVIVPTVRDTPPECPDKSHKEAPPDDKKGKQKTDSSANVQTDAGQDAAN